MKKTILISIMMFNVLALFGQQNLNLIIFSENGETFDAYINGIKQNDEPAANIRITDIKSAAQQIRIVFSDADLGILTKNAAMPFGQEYTTIIKRNRKGRLVLREFGMVPLEQSKESTENDIAYHETAVEDPVYDTETKVNETTSLTQTTHTTSTPNGEKINVGVSMAGVDFNVNVDVSDDNMNVDMGGTGMDTELEVAQTSATTTYTESSSTSNSYETVEDEGCTTPMGMLDFSDAKKSIASKSFSDTRMTIAKQITKNNCLSANQVKEIVELFSFEESKLAYAKFAHDYTVDKNNFYKVNDAFTFESSIDELNEYIDSK